MKKEIRVKVKDPTDIGLKNRLAGLMMLNTGKTIEDIDVYDVEGILVLNLTGQEPNYIIEKLADSLEKVFGEQITIL